MKVIYSLKKDEVLVSNQNGLWEDFAENLWSPKDKFFKAMFHPVVIVSSERKKKPVNPKRIRK